MNGKKLIKFSLLIPILYLTLVYTQLSNLGEQVNGFWARNLIVWLLYTGLFAIAPIIIGLSEISDAFKSKKNQFSNIAKNLLSILVYVFILFVCVSSIVSTNEKAFKTFDSLFVTEKENYPIENITLKKENEYFRNRIEYEVSYLDKNGKRKEIAISRSETDVDIYSKDNKKMNLQVNFKFIPKTVAEKYNIKNYKDYDSVSYKILESKS